MASRPGAAWLLGTLATAAACALLGGERVVALAAQLRKRSKRALSRGAREPGRGGTGRGGARGAKAPEAKMGVVLSWRCADQPRAFVAIQIFCSVHCHFIFIFVTVIPINLGA